MGSAYRVRNGFSVSLVQAQAQKPFHTIVHDGLLCHYRRVVTLAQGMRLDWTSAWNRVQMWTELGSGLHTCHMPYARASCLLRMCRMHLQNCQGTDNGGTADLGQGNASYIEGYGYNSVFFRI